MLDQAERRFGPAELQALISLAITMAVMAVLLVLAGRHALLGARLVVYRRVYGPDPGRHYLAVAGQSRNLRRPQPLPAGRQQRLGCDCRLAHHDRDRRHIARRGPRRQAFRLGSGARLGHRIGLCPARRFLCLGRLGASGQPSFRADRAHPEGTRAQGDRHRPLRFCPPSRLHRRHRPCDRHRAGARLALGAGPGGGGHHPAGRPHAWRGGGAQGGAGRATPNTCSACAIAGCRGSGEGRLASPLEGSGSERGAAPVIAAAARLLAPR